MLYPVCPTCGNLLADKQLIYEDKLEKITNSKMTNEKKLQAKEKLLDELGLKKYCCRFRIISYLDQVKLIV